MFNQWFDKLSLRSKATLVVLTITTAALAVVAGAGIVQMQRQIIAEEQRTADAVAQGIGNAAELALAVRDERELARMANGCLRDPQILFVAIADAKAKILAKAQRDPQAWQSYLDGRAGKGRRIPDRGEASAAFIGTERVRRRSGR